MKRLKQKYSQDVESFLLSSSAFGLREIMNHEKQQQRHYFTLITHENFTASALLTNILHVKAADTTNTAVGDKQCRWATLLATRQQRGQQDRRRKK